MSTLFDDVVFFYQWSNFNKISYSNHIRDTNATIIVAAHNRLREEPEQFRVWSKNIIIHPEYIAALLRNDVALIRLNLPLTWNQFVKPVLLPRATQQSLSFDGELGTISGWGRFSDDISHSSEVLNWIQAPIIENALCNRWFFGTIQESNICTEQAICHGDSGGPLTVVDEHGEIIQVGVVSFLFTLGCERGWPSGYARITSFQEWIYLHTGSSLKPRY